MHNKVFQSQRLTEDFVKKHGFSFNERIEEEDFAWNEYRNAKYPMITIFFNYYADGKITYDVEIESWALHNVDKSRFLTLLNMLKPTEDA